MGSSQKAILLGEIAFGTAKAQDIDFFATDIKIPLSGGYGKRCVIQGVFNSSKNLAITIDGSNYISSGSKDTLFQIELFVYEGDVINFKCPDAGGVTINFFRVDLVD